MMTHPQRSAQSGETATLASTISQELEELTDRCLRTRVHEGFHRVSIDLDIDVKHVNVPEGLRLNCQPSTEIPRIQLTEYSIACSMFSNTRSILIASSILFCA
jgi:hypothetical protein